MSEYKRIYQDVDGNVKLIDGMRELNHVFEYFGITLQYNLTIELRKDGIHMFANNMKQCCWTYPVDHPHAPKVELESWGIGELENVGRGEFDTEAQRLRGGELENVGRGGVDTEERNKKVAMENGELPTRLHRLLHKEAQEHKDNTNNLTGKE